MEAGDLQRMDDPGKVSLVIPVYNPGPRLERTWREVRNFLDGPGADWEVLFVCDGCTDDSASRLARWIRPASQRVQLLYHSPNRGKGYSVRRGLEAASGRWRLFTDVDLAYGFDSALNVVRTLQAGADVAIASRTHPSSRLVLPVQLQGYCYRRYLQSLAFSTLVRCLLPLTIQDTQAGLKGMTARAARVLLPRLQCQGFGFDCELLTACHSLDLRVAEVPVCVRYDDAASTIRPASLAKMVRELWTIRRTWRDVRMQRPGPHPAPPPLVGEGQRAA